MVVIAYNSRFWLKRKQSILIFQWNPKYFEKWCMTDALKNVLVCPHSTNLDEETDHSWNLTFTPA